MDRQRLHARVRRLPAARRPRRRPARAKAPLPRRPRRVHGGVAARRPRAELGDADRCRALQGLGAAFISPAALSIITTTFEEGADRAKALGVWAAIAIGGGAVGLLLGGASRSCLVAMDLLRQRPGRDRRVHRGAALPARVEGRAAHRTFDVLGAICVTGGLMTLVYAIVEAEEHGWGSPRDDRDVRGRGDPARRVRLRRAASEGAARAALDLPHPLAERGERRHVPGRVRGSSRCSSSPRSTCSRYSATSR